MGQSLFHIAPQSPPPNVTSTRMSPTNASVEWDGIRSEDLRGWLVDYEIGYGSVMMSVHQQCPANDSTTLRPCLWIVKESMN